MTDEPQVIIVGGGPVGVALAVDLAQRNVTSVVIERHEAVGTIPKGQSLMQRTLEHFYFWNCVDELRAARVLPTGYPIGGITAYESLSSDYWYLPEGLGGVSQYFFQENERLPQYKTEEVLRQRAAQLPQISFRFHTTATDVTEVDGKVNVTVENTDDPTITEQLSARFVVGCDGGRSIVRESVGITRTSRDFEQKMVLTVFASKELHAGLERFPERTTYRVLNPKYKGIWQFFGRVRLGETWFYHGPVPNNTTAADTELLKEMLAEVAGFPFACEFEHIGFWDLRIEVADRYRSGRVFIAGDACHTHPPYGGLGLNTGLDDVANLGWKIAANLGGWGGEGLLSSYSEERQPIFAETGSDLIGQWIDDDAAFFRTYDPKIDEVAFANAWSARTGGEFAPPWYEPHYDGSSVIEGAPTDEIGVHGAHTFTAQAGHHLAPAVLSGGTSVYEELGRGFTLLAFDADPTSVANFVACAAELAIPLTVIRDDLADERVRYGSSLILVRPDHFVGWCGDEMPKDLDGLLRKLCGIATE